MSVEDGRELLRARALELGMAADVAKDTAGQLAKRRKLDKELEALSKDKGKTPTTKEEWKKWIDDILAEVDKQLGQLDRDFQSFKQRADTLEQSYALANTQLTAIKANMNLLHGQPMGHLKIMVLKDQLVACNDQITAYQVEYNVVVGKMSDVVERASGIANRRTSAIARYEMESGDTIPKNPDLDKWATRLSAKRPKLAAKPAAKTSKKAATENKRPSTLKALMPLDLEHERDEVLASFGFRTPTPVDVPAAAEGAASATDARTAPATEK
jgi:chromosome segregation ATPase